MQRGEKAAAHHPGSTVLSVWWTGTPTWLALEFAAVLLIDEAGG